MSNVKGDVADVILETADEPCANRDAVETKLDIMSMSVFIENELKAIDEVIECHRSSGKTKGNNQEKQDSNSLAVIQEKREKCSYKYCENIKHQ